MEKVSAWDLIWIGKEMRFLQDASTGWLPNTRGGIIENYDRLLEDLRGARLLVSAAAAVVALDDVTGRLRGAGANYPLTATDVNELSAGTQALHVALVAESQSSVIYRTTERRYDIVRLTDEVEKLFGEVAFGQLSDIARHDFAEAGRSIAFGLPTAAAFHLLRGTEEVLRMYYRSWIRRNRIDPILWGPAVAALRAISGRRRPDATTLNHLDNIRVSFRNPTDHPEKVYDIGEAEDLFGLCIDVVNRMVRGLRS
jgi:hypothetical protein